jgi:hypothetical protein
VCTPWLQYHDHHHRRVLVMVVTGCVNGDNDCICTVAEFVLLWRWLNMWNQLVPRRVAWLSPLELHVNHSPFGSTSVWPSDVGRIPVRCYRWQYGTFWVACYSFFFKFTAGTKAKMHRKSSNAGFFFSFYIQTLSKFSAERIIRVLLRKVLVKNMLSFS